MARDIVLEISAVSHRFGPKPVLHDVNLKVVRGEIVGLVGPSGCGKSTLLRAVVGTHPPSAGAVLVKAAGAEAARIVTSPGRDRGIVYQQYTLFPFLTARENVAVGLMLDQAGIPFRLFKCPAWRRLRRQHLEQAEALLEELKLKDAVRQYPHQMSGGMRQRVAIAQTLIMNPDIILLDEPFGALDEATREELQRMLLTLYGENCRAKERGQPPRCTILIVTHELNEAIYVGDRVVGLSQYWDWKAGGHDACPGATVVYDRTTPVYQPGEEPDFQDFSRQRAEIRRAAFDPDVPTDPSANVRFWEEVAAGSGRGILA
jgi:NitT/TauT family transport system ATP-binding protein